MARFLFVLRDAERRVWRFFGLFEVEAVAVDLEGLGVRDESDGAGRTREDFFGRLVGTEKDPALLPLSGR